MSDMFLIETWATMDHYELQSISSATLLQGIRSAATEIERLRAEGDEAREAARWLWKRHVVMEDEIGYLEKLTWLGEDE